MRYLSFLLFVFISIQLSAQPERFKKSNEGDKAEQEETTDQNNTAQKTDAAKSPFFQNLVYGGTLSLQLRNIISIYLSPQVGYKFNEKLVAGPGFIYYYLRYDINQINITDQIYGPSAFITWFPFDKIFLGSQYEYLNFDYTYANGGNLFSEEQWSSILWLQGGYAMRTGNNGFVQLGIRINLLHGLGRSPYANNWYPVINFFF